MTQPQKPPSGEEAASPVRDAPAFDFYPERWLVGVAGMSDAEQLAYLRLLCHQWLLGDAGLPEDAPALKRLAGKGVTPTVLAKLPLRADGKRRNARLETIREEQRKRIATSRRKIAQMNAARAAGKAAPKGGRAPKDGLQAEASQEEDVQGSLQDALQEDLGEDRGDALQGGLEEAFEGRRRERLGGDHGEPLDGFLTTHHSPPTPFLRESSAGAWPGLAEIQAYAPTVMALPECAESFWNGLESCGWVNKFGQPVSDWKPLFRNFATAWKSRDSQAKRSGSPPAKPKNQAYQRPAHVSEADTQF